MPVVLLSVEPSADGAWVFETVTETVAVDEPSLTESVVAPLGRLFVLTEIE